VSPTSALAPLRERFLANERLFVRGAALVALVVAVLLPFVGGAYAVSMGTRILIYGLLATSIAVLIRLVQLLPLGHAAMMGAGAYGVAIAQVRWDVGFWPSAAFGLLVGVVVTLVLGVMVLRATGLYFVMITVAQGMILWGIAQRWATMTGGDNGMRGISRPAAFLSARDYYWLTLAVVLASLFVIYRFSRSTLALRLRGVGDSSKRMSALGYWPPLYRFVAFCVSGFFAALSGVMYVGYFQFISPSTVHVGTSVEAVLMVILGGANAFVGPLVGAVAVLSARSFVIGYTARWATVLGVVFILVVMFARTGIAGAFRMLLYGAGSQHLVGDPLGATGVPKLTEPSEQDEEDEEIVAR
jgi:branched-chain amino acid transport system permease protein